MANKGARVGRRLKDVLNENVGHLPDGCSSETEWASSTTFIGAASRLGGERPLFVETMPSCQSG